jgi:hypothetical protein
MRELGRFGVLRAVEFDDDLCTMANEIDIIAPDRGLAAKVQPFGLERPQPRPEEAFGVGCVGSQISRALIGHDPHPKFASLTLANFDLPAKGR